MATIREYAVVQVNIPAPGNDKCTAYEALEATKALVQIDNSHFGKHDGRVLYEVAGPATTGETPDWDEEQVYVIRCQQRKHPQSDDRFTVNAAQVMHNQRAMKATEFENFYLDLMNQFPVMAIAD